MRLADKMRLALVVQGIALLAIAVTGEPLAWLVLAVLIKLLAVLEPDEPEWSNCYVWAVARWITCGGHVAWRSSRWGWFLHFRWSPDGQVWQAYEPIAEHRRYKLLPPMWFRGRVVVGAR